jgi:hypothetical protein
MGRKQDSELASARAYFRLAAKASRAGQPHQAASYRRTAERKLAAYHRRKEYIRRTFKS